MNESWVNMNNLPGPNILNQASLSPHSLSLTHVHEHPQASIKQCLLVLLTSLFPHLLVTSPFHGLSFTGIDLSASTIQSTCCSKKALCTRACSDMLIQEVKVQLQSSTGLLVYLLCLVQTTLLFRRHQTGGPPVAHNGGQFMNTPLPWLSSPPDSPYVPLLLLLETLYK